MTVSCPIIKSRYRLESTQVRAHRGENSARVNGLLLNTPIIESNFRDESDFQGIDILRAIQSFDPCMPCNTHLRVEETGAMLDREVITSCAI